VTGRRLATLGATFLRRPRGAEWIADALRVVAVLSVPAAGIGWGPVALAVMMLALLGVVVPRALGVRPGLDIAVVALSLVAGWSSVLGWYTSVFLWDKVVHVTFLTVLSAVAWVIGTAPR
jgi:hypothetical protein